MNNNNDKISNENNKGEKGIYRNISLNLDNERIIPNNTNDISSNNLKGNEIIQLEDELKKKLNDEKIKNKKLDKENKDLKESLNKINQNHLNEMNKIKSELDKYKKEKEKLKSELDKYKNEKLKQDLIKVNKIISGIDNYQIDANEIKNLKDENNKLKNELSLKENEIKDLKNNLQNCTKIDKKVYYKDIIVITFVSMDSSVQFGVKCLQTDLFDEVEEKLYKKYDDLRNTNNMFIANAKPVLRFKKICENNIKDGDIIQIFKLE